ncbi:MAG: hypothetical protein ACE5K2_07200, partial [Candidatus Zixiibacteriota bacterium]
KSVHGKLILGICLILVVAVSLCTAPNDVPPTPMDNETNVTGPPTNTTTLVEVPTVYVSESGDVSPEACAARGIDGKVLVMHQTGCPACARAVPLLEELETEFTGIEFEFLNLAEPEGRDRFQELDIVIYYVPVAIIDCHALVGAHPKDTYKAFIEEM